MKHRVPVFLGCFLFSIALIWSMIFTTDYIRCSHLMRPIFVIGVADTLADDGGSGTYQGLGYTVVVKGTLTDEYGYVPESVTMSAFGKVVAASIA